MWHFQTFVALTQESHKAAYLGLQLYLIYTSDLPTLACITTETFADDTAVLATQRDPVEAPKTQQDCLDDISDRLKKWRLKVNESKAVNVTFTLKNRYLPTIKT